MFDIDDLIDDLDSTSEFEEVPVSLDIFMGRGYLEQTGVTLSWYQKEMIEHMTQVFRYETLVELYGEKQAKALDNYTVREVICMVGKGSGKDYCAEIACAYAVYKLLCLKDPAKYFGKPPGDSIDIINIAINADQAQNVFFSGFKRMVKNSPWFAGKFDAKQRSIAFDKNITVFSGHSQAEAFEGYNIFMAVLDEIAGFEHFTKGEDEDGKSPAQAIYDMYDASITSRFGDNGKLVLLSFPRQKGDFIETRYREVVGEVVSHPQAHTFVINPKLPADTPGNSFDIEWTVDEILSYAEGSVWALRRPSWDVNPTKDIDMYVRDFFREPTKALGKFAAEPQESAGGFFEDYDAIDNFSNYKNAFDENGSFLPTFKPKEDVRYYVHVDLARKHDRCVVSMAHVETWRKAGMQGGDEEFVPVIKVDLIKTWKPDRDRQVDFTEVREFIMALVRAGWPIKKVTFDQWQSEEMIKYFNRVGIESDVLSVGLPHYMDLKLIIAEKRGMAPHSEVLRRELKQLFITKNGKNVDHPRTKEGSKDVSDSVCGAIFNAANLTPKVNKFTFQIMSEDDYEQPLNIPSDTLPIKTPKGDRAKMPADIAKFLELL